jgi:hypothetical protein
MTRKVILYIAMSLDGYIAKDNDNIDFLSIVESPGEDYGYSAFLKVLFRTKKGRDNNVDNTVVIQMNIKEIKDSDA